MGNRIVKTTGVVYSRQNASPVNSPSTPAIVGWRRLGARITLNASVARYVKRIWKDKAFSQKAADHFARLTPKIILKQTFFSSAISFQILLLSCDLLLFLDLTRILG